MPAFAPAERPVFEGGRLLASVGVAALVSGLVADGDGDGAGVGVMKSLDCQRIETPFAFIPNPPVWLTSVPTSV